MIEKLLAAGTEKGRAQAPQSMAEIGLAEFAPYLLNRVSAHYTQDLQDALRPLGFTTSKLRTLVVLSLRSGLTVNDLADDTATEQSTMSRTLDALEADGLIRREPSPSDMRVRHVYITEAGEQKLDEVWPLMLSAHGRLFAGISPREYRMLLATLHKLLGNLGAREFRSSSSGAEPT